MMAMLVKEITPKGLKVYENMTHIKTMPKKFKKVLRKKHIINPKRKRLTQEERFLLEVSIYELQLKLEQPYIYEHIKRSTPYAVRKVFPRTLPAYYLLIYKNGKKIKCPKTIFNAAPHILSPLNAIKEIMNLQIAIPN